MSDPHRSEPHLAPRMPEIAVGADEVREGLAMLCRSYLIDGMVRGAASLGVEVTHAELAEAMQSGTETGPSVWRAQDLIRRRQAGEV